jgi:hypothetical protein
MQRMQQYQGSTTHLHLGVWNIAFAEMGYEGHQLAYSEITEDQEMRLLDVIQKMSGVEL